MLASALITDIRQQLGDTEDKHYSDAELLDLINQAAEDFAKTTFCLQASDSLTTDGVASSFALSGLTYDHVVIFLVQYNGDKLHQASAIEAGRWSPVPGTPLGWHEWNGSIYLDAIPAALDGGLTVWYTRLPNRLTSTSGTLDFPDEWISALVDYVLYKCRDKDMEGGLADRSHADYENKKAVAHQIYKAKLGLQ